MFSSKFINSFLKIGIQTWLKFICKRIKVNKLKIIVNNKIIGIVDKLYLEASDLIYQNLYINKLILNIYDFELKTNYKNHIIYSDNMVISCVLKIDSINLEKIFLMNKIGNIRTHLQKKFTEGNNILNLYINNGLINLKYQKNNLHIKKELALKLNKDSLYLEDLQNKKKVKIPLDKNIKIRSCLIQNKLININLSSKVIFDS